MSNHFIAAMQHAGLVRLFRTTWQINPRIGKVWLVANCMMGLLATLQLHCIRSILDVGQLYITKSAPIQMLVLWFGGLILASTATSCLRSALAPLKDELGETVRQQVEELCYQKVQELPLEQLENPTTYNLLRRARQGAEQRILSLLGFFSGGTTLLVANLSLLGYLGSIHLGVPLLLAVGTTPGVILRAKYLTRRYLLTHQQTPDERRLAALGRLLVERATAAEVRVYNLAPWLITQASSLMQRLRNQRLQHERGQARLSLWAGVCNAVAYAGTMAFIIYLMMQGHLMVATCIALFYTIETFQSTYNSLLWNFAIANNDLRYLNDLFAFLSLPVSTASDKVEFVRPTATQIEFHNVSFTYPGSKTPALTNVSFSIHPGERIALVGENGAGKSTLVKLMMGLYAPTEGKILVDERDLRELDQVEWRKHIGAVFQDFTRYQTTVRNNISFGWVEGRDNAEAVAVAASNSGAMDFIPGLSDGFDTLLGRNFHNGTELSTGQWQKLAIARAYFRPADILVLDEPASGLDAKAEAEVYQHFATMAGNKTVLLISHRLGSCRLANRILVLNKGSVVEEGTHQQLLTADGEYASMYRTQAEWYA